MRLNQKLVEANERKEIVICGGAAMILGQHNREETQDVDMLRPDKDQLLQKLSREIAIETGSIRPDWLNSNCSAFIFEYPLPENWEDRLVVKLSSSHLVVKSLCDEDLLFTKICAHVDREMDEEDVRLLAQDKRMFLKSVDQVLQLKRYQSLETEMIIDELKIRLGFDDE